MMFDKLLLVESNAAALPVSLAVSPPLAAASLSAVVFVDNVRASNPRMAIDMPAEVVDRIVLYRPVQAGNLFGLGSGNGVLMIFTKR